MTKRKRAAAMVLACLAFLIFCGVPFQQVHAVAVTSTAVIAIIIAALAAMGITFSMTGGYQTLTNWLSEQIDNSGIDFSGVRYGVSSAGQILINNAFLRRVQALALYLQNELGLVSNSYKQVLSAGATWGQFTIYVGTFEWEGRLASGGLAADVEAYAISSGAPFIVGNLAGTSTAAWKALFIWRAPFQIYSYFKRGSTTVADRTIQATRYGDTDLYYAESDGYYPSTATNRPTYEHYNMTTAQILAAVADQMIHYGNDLAAVTGTLTIPATSDLDGMGGVIDLPADWGATLGEIITDIPDLVLDDDLAGNTTLDLEAEGDVADSIDQSATSSEVISANPDDYSVSGLSEVFPFCIPFDLYDFLDCLAAEPEAPSVTWRFYVPRVCDETFEIDFEEFETVAQILRTMELLLFCVGLAFVTRHLLRG